MKLKRTITKLSFLSLTAAIMLTTTGCSLKNPFGVGYDSSVCEASKDFGVCGAPKDIYKYRGKIKKVQYDYLHAQLDTVLFFGISKDGEIVVKEDRDGPWERYDLSEWKNIIEEEIARQQELKDEINNKINKGKISKRTAGVTIYQSDIPTSEETDLSVKYQDQGPLLTTRTSIGDIIRDTGHIQQIYIANYVDRGGDLISGHELYVVVKEPEWIVGEKTPHSTRLESVPTPISKELFHRQNRTNEYQNNVVNTYNRDSIKGSIESIVDNPYHADKKENKDNDLIKSFIK